MVFGFLVVLGEQFFSGLIGCSGNGRAALATLDDANFQMWYWHLWLNLLLMVQKKTDTFQHGRVGDIHLLSGNDCGQSRLSCDRFGAMSTADAQHLHRVAGKASAGEV